MSLSALSARLQALVTQLWPPASLLTPSLSLQLTMTAWSVVISRSGTDHPLVTWPQLHRLIGSGLCLCIWSNYRDFHRTASHCKSLALQHLNKAHDDLDIWGKISLLYRLCCWWSLIVIADHWPDALFEIWLFLGPAVCCIYIRYAHNILYFQNQGFRTIFLT